MTNDSTKNNTPTINRIAPATYNKVRVQFGSEGITPATTNKIMPIITAPIDDSKDR